MNESRPMISMSERYSRRPRAMVEPTNPATPVIRARIGYRPSATGHRTSDIASRLSRHHEKLFAENRPDERQPEIELQRPQGRIAPARHRVRQESRQRALNRESGQLQHFDER